MKKTRWVETQLINMAYMVAIDTFVRTNDDINTALRNKHRELFKSDWYVAWMRGGEELMRPANLNGEILRRELQRIELEMCDMVLMFGFAGYYCVKDMEKWIKTDPERRATKCPFGVIPLRPSPGACANANGNCRNQVTMYGSYVRYVNPHTMEEAIGFEPHDDSLGHHYTFGVFDNGAKFVSINDGVAPVSNPSAPQSYQISMELVPVSPFAALYRQRSLLEEAIDNHYDAEFQLSHPQTFIAPKLQKDPPPDSISESILYSSDTLEGANQSNIARKQNYATQNIRYMIERINYTIAPVGRNNNHHRPEDLVRNQRKLKYRRPDISEGMHPLSEAVDITTAHAAAVLTNLAELQHQYELAVCRAVRIPYLFFNSDSGGSSGGGGSGNSSMNRANSINEEQLQFCHGRLDKEIDADHELMSRFFTLMYELTYYDLDLLTMIDYYNVTDMMTPIKKEDGEEVGGNATYTGMDIESVSAKNRAVNNLRDVKVSLFFEKSPKTHASASLPFLLQCLEKEVIDKSYMQKQIYLAYGERDDLLK